MAADQDVKDLIGKKGRHWSVLLRGVILSPGHGITLITSPINTICIVALRISCRGTQMVNVSGLPQVIKGAHITQLNLRFLAFPHLLS